MNSTQYSDETEREKHYRSVEYLSLYFNLPREFVARVYEKELIVMAQTAIVRDYLPILVSRKVKEILRHCQRMPAKNPVMSCRVDQGKKNYMILNY